MRKMTVYFLKKERKKQYVYPKSYDFLIKDEEAEAFEKSDKPAVTYIQTKSPQDTGFRTKPVLVFSVSEATAEDENKLTDAAKPDLSVARKSLKFRKAKDSEEKALNKFIETHFGN